MEGRREGGGGEEEGEGGKGYEKEPKVCHWAQDPQLNVLQH